MLSTKRFKALRTPRSKAVAIARAMLDKKATDVVILRVAPLTSVADYLVIGSADSDRQASAIATHINGILALAKSKVSRVEGTRSSQWVLMDMGDVIAHLFRKDVRAHYGLERLWADAKCTIIEDARPAPKKPTRNFQPIKVRKKISRKIKA